MNPCRIGGPGGGAPQADATGQDRAVCDSFVTNAAFKLPTAERPKAATACMGQVSSMPRGTEDRPVRAAELCEWFTYEVLRWDGEKAERATSACADEQ